MTTAAPNYDRVMAALAFADGLMAGDPAAFKAGYTRANAEIAAIESYDLGGADRDAFLRIMAQKYDGFVRPVDGAQVHASGSEFNGRSR